MNSARVAWLFLRVGIMNDMQYRVNFIIQLFQSAIAIGTGLIGLWLVFSHTNTLDGWTRPELLAVLGVYTLMGGLISAIIQPNMQQLMTDIQQGTLDFLLVKPEDSQLIASVRQVEIWEAVDVLTGALVMAIAATQLQSGVGLLAALAFLYVLFLGGIMIYCFWLMLTTAAFWFVRMDAIVELFQGIYAAGRFPIGIYPGWLRYGLTFLVPVAFAVTVPAEALTGRLTLTTLLGATGLALALLGIARLFWRRGIRRYAGASA